MWLSRWWDPAAKEAAKWLAGCLLQAQGVAAAFSQYPMPKRMRWRTTKSPTMNTAPTVENMDMARVLTQHLGQTHALPMAQTVATVAEQTTLQPCTTAKTNQSNRPYSFPERPSSRMENALFDSVSITTNCSHNTSTPAKSHDHQLHNHLTDHWVHQASQPIMTSRCLGLSHWISCRSKSCQPLDTGQN